MACGNFVYTQMLGYTQTALAASPLSLASPVANAVGDGAKPLPMHIILTFSGAKHGYQNNNRNFRH